nr:E3 ubiquitin-protein ligase ARIH2-like [Monopterus albus]
MLGSLSPSCDADESFSFQDRASRFVCGQSGCNVEWPYEEVCKMALLTPEEMREFEIKLASNAASCYLSIKSCPGCRSSVMRKNESNLRVRCTVCTTNKGRTFEFCWQCLKEWKGPAPRSDRCDNHGCCNEDLKLLRECSDISFEYFDSVKGIKGCPSIRSCPTCGILVAHDGTKCKNVVCSRCKVEFCFVCLKLTTECRKINPEYFTHCSSGVAPRQTSIPVWQKK